MKFTKMHGLGNDFIIVDYDEAKKCIGKLEYNEKLSEFAKKICDRNFGVGADGLIIVNPEVKDIGWFFYNSDGSIAQMCGNGMRCFARYVYDKKFANNKKFKVQTLAGTIIPEILNKNTIKVNMGKPIFDAQKIPFTADPKAFEVEGFKARALSMGNPHCIIFTNGDTKELARTQGAKIEANRLFPEKTNVEFARVLSRKEITLDVWERGCGITKACGTGACATAVAAISEGLTDNDVKINLPGGSLTIQWDGELESFVFMAGPAEYVFEGEVL